MTRLVRYKLHLECENEAIRQALEGRIPAQVGRLAEGREYRKALAQLFGGDAHVTGDARLRITSVSTQGARVRRV